MKIGVLDIQGSVAEHLVMLNRLAEEVVEVVDVVAVKTAADMKGLKGLIIPGGESTTIGKLLRRFGLRDEIIRRAKKGMAVWGTCAGAILISKQTFGDAEADVLGLMHIVVERNAYGRQQDSFEKEIDFLEGDEPRPISGVFIRAPRIEEIGEGVEIVVMDGSEIVAVREGRFLASTFHPELTDDLTMHRYFVEMCT
jgi:pyridoxal 5'-phosphate synthase pdxT subunit